MKQSHWVTFAFILPYFVLVLLHETMDLSDALMLANDQRDLDSRSFNLVMLLSLSLGICGFVFHASYIRFRGERAFWFKLATLAVGVVATLLWTSK